MSDEGGDTGVKRMTSGSLGIFVTASQFDGAFMFAPAADSSTLGKVGTLGTLVVAEGH